MVFPKRSNEKEDKMTELDNTMNGHSITSISRTSGLLTFTLMILVIAALIPGLEAGVVVRHKRALDNLMGHGFTGFDKRAFDSLGHDGFSPFDKRNFYPVSDQGIEMHFNKKRAFDSLNMPHFSGFQKRAFDTVGFGGLSDFGYFDKRAFDSLAHDGFGGFDRRR